MNGKVNNGEQSIAHVTFAEHKRTVPNFIRSCLAFHWMASVTVKRRKGNHLSHQFRIQANMNKLNVCVSVCGACLR